MIKKITLFTTIFLLFLVMANKVLAQGFTLQSIGNSTVGGRTISSWSYTSLRPTFRGTADPGAAVVLTINGTAVQVNADSSGNWVYTPTADLRVGDNSISIASGASQLQFTLTLSQSSQPTLPKTGGAWPTLALLVLSSGMFLGAKKFLG